VELGCRRGRVKTLSPKTYQDLADKDMTFGMRREAV